MDEESVLPAILCLHGYGTNASIFRYQLRNLIATLSTNFRFIVPDAPFEVDAPGPGATSIDAGPFRRWHSNKGIAGLFGMSEAKLRDEMMTVRDLLRSTMEREGPIVGVLAFSQGACLGSALCMDRELGRHIKFGVFVCALFPAVELGEESSGVGEKQIKIPCVHIRGSADPYGGQGLKLYERYFVGEKARMVVKFEGRHEVPNRQTDVVRTAEEILGVWEGLENGQPDSIGSLPW